MRPAAPHHSHLYRGWVRHRRFAPVANQFRYRLFLLYMDLEELPSLFDHHPLFAYERPWIAAFHRADYHGPEAMPLREAVADTVQARTGHRPAGPIRMLTHLRYFGYCFNPVTFYYCWDPAGTRVEAILAEITNTPWGERHAYVLDARANEGDERHMRWRFPKAFHISPFIDMDTDYDWRFTPPGETLTVHMRDSRRGAKFFDATLRLERRPWRGSELGFALTRHPLMTARVVGLIHWQALKLWWKGAPWYDHPRFRPAAEPLASLEKPA